MKRLFGRNKKAKETVAAASSASLHDGSDANAADSGLRRWNSASEQGQLSPNSLDHGTAATHKPQFMLDVNLPSDAAYAGANGRHAGNAGPPSLGDHHLRGGHVGRDAPQVAPAFEGAAPAANAANLLPSSSAPAADEPGMFDDVLIRFQLLSRAVDSLELGQGSQDGNASSSASRAAAAACAPMSAVGGATTPKPNVYSSAAAGSTTAAKPLQHKPSGPSQFSTASQDNYASIYESFMSTSGLYSNDRATAQNHSQPANAPSYGIHSASNKPSLEGSSRDLYRMFASASQSGSTPAPKTQHSTVKPDTSAQLPSDSEGDSGDDHDDAHSTSTSDSDGEAWHRGGRSHGTSSSGPSISRAVNGPPITNQDAKIHGYLKSIHVAEKKKSMAAANGRGGAWSGAASARKMGSHRHVEDGDNIEDMALGRLVAPKPTVPGAAGSGFGTQRPGSAPLSEDPATHRVTMMMPPMPPVPGVPMPMPGSMVDGNMYMPPGHPPFAAAPGVFVGGGSRVQSPEQEGTSGKSKKDRKKRKEKKLKSKAQDGDVEQVDEEGEGDKKKKKRKATKDKKSKKSSKQKGEDDEAAAAKSQPVEDCGDSNAEGDHQSRRKGKKSSKAKSSRSRKSTRPNSESDESSAAESESEAELSDSESESDSDQASELSDEDVVQRRRRRRKQKEKSLAKKKGASGGKLQAVPSVNNQYYSPAMQYSPPQQAMPDFSPMGTASHASVPAPINSNVPHSMPSLPTPPLSIASSTSGSKSGNGVLPTRAGGGISPPLVYESDSSESSSESAKWRRSVAAGRSRQSQWGPHQAHHQHYRQTTNPPMPGAPQPQHQYSFDDHMYLRSGRLAGDNMVPGGHHPRSTQYSHHPSAGHGHYGAHGAPHMGHRPMPAMQKQLRYSAARAPNYH